MTNTRVSEKDRYRVKGELGSLCLLAAVLLFGMTLSGESAEYVREGMRLAVGCVIPSSFPFMIISDFYVIHGRPENIRLLRAVLKDIFGIPTEGLGTFILGNIGGFPIGAKACADAYSMGLINKDEAERLLPLCNNPSCAFIVGGVGMGMWSDIRIGIILLGSVFSATLVCALITREKCDKNSISIHKSEQKYDFVSSVKSSGSSTIGIISFISLFSVALGIIKKRVSYASILYPLYAFSEVTNAVNAFSRDTAFSPILRLAACAFALGFGGICVGMQSSFFTSQSGLKMTRYYKIKLLEGLLSASFATLFYQI